MTPFLLEPAIKDYIWGGTRLRDEYGKESDLERLAESWELSCHP
ncbi:MAG TPA: mannose-6-phosphate isomerase, partial [Ruminococcus sp.]|nr:mannose-6-phosphate isomerase [Ruminococcus sp.]